MFRGLAEGSENLQPLDNRLVDSTACALYQVGVAWRTCEHRCVCLILVRWLLQQAWEICSVESNLEVPLPGTHA